VGKYAACAQTKSFLLFTTLHRHLDLGTITVSVQKAPSTKDVCFKDLRNEVELKINVLQVTHFIIAIWQQVMLSNIVKFFHQCSYGYELNTHTQGNSDSNTEYENDDFHDGWICLHAEKNTDFSSYVSADNKTPFADFWC
jgi:hypothetical protein